MATRPHVLRLLEQSNDVERNPGPLPHRLVRPPVTGARGKGPPVRGRSEERPPEPPERNVHFKDFDDMKTLLDTQKEQIVQQKEEIKWLKKKVEDNEKHTKDIQSEFGDMKRKWQSTGDIPTAMAQHTDATVAKIESLVGAYNDIQDRLYEIDKSWKNNLIFYGVTMETNSDYEDPYATEEKVREVIKRKLRISREMHLNRVTRITHGPDFRGQKPDPGPFRKLLGQGGGSEEVQVIEGRQHPHLRGLLSQGEGTQAGAEQVHPRDPSSRPSQDESLCATTNSTWGTRSFSTTTRLGEWRGSITGSWTAAVPTVTWWTV